MKNYPSGTSEIQAALARFIRFDATEKYLEKRFKWLDGMTPTEFAEQHGVDALADRVNAVRKEMRGGYRG